MIKKFLVLGLLFFGNGNITSGILVSSAHGQSFQEDFEDFVDEDFDPVGEDFFSENLDTDNFSGLEEDFSQEDLAEDYDDDFFTQESGTEVGEGLEASEEIEEIKDIESSILKEEEVAFEEEPKWEEKKEIGNKEDVHVETLRPKSSPVFDDDPDLQYEAELYDIYLKYHSKPMSDKDWDIIAGSKISEVYTVQKGDNLWDLSRTFFGDGNYWPKIWSVNSNITNPHLIEPKNVIRFILGNENEAPMFTVTEAEEGSLPAEEESVELTSEEIRLEDLTKGLETIEVELVQDLTETSNEEELLSDEELEGIVVPPSEILVRPVVQSFPPSLPEWKSYIDSLINSRKVSIAASPKKVKKTQLALTHYIDENQPVGLAKVVGVEGGGHVATHYQYIYIRAKRGLLRENDKLLVIYNRGPLLLNSKVQEEAVVWEVQGQVQIEFEVEATKKYRSNQFVVFRAYVESALSPIELGAEVIRGKYTYIDEDKKGRVPHVSGSIIGGAMSNRRELLSRDSVAYLNVGTREGLAVGDLLPIYSNNYVEDRNPYVVTTKKPMGLVKIVKVTELYSTGFILENNGSINIGDFVGAKSGFEKQHFSPRTISRRKDDVHEKETDTEIEEIQFLLNQIEDDIDPASLETYEYMD